MGTALVLGAELAAASARLALGLLFLSSALAKLHNLSDFAAGLRAYQLVPAAALPPLALLLPLLELLLALALLLGVGLPLAGAASAGLLLLFSAAVGLNLLRGRRIDCHCHGLAGSQLISWGLVARNLVLLAPCTLLVWHGATAAWPPVTALALVSLALLVTSWFVLSGLIHAAVDTTLAVRAAISQ